MWGAGPSRNSGGVVAECSIVNLRNEDPEEGGGLPARVGLELRLDIDNKGGSDGGEQTGLSYTSAYASLREYVTYEDQSCVQILIVFLQELSIVLLGHSSIIPVKSNTGILLGGHNILSPAVWCCVPSGTHGRASPSYVDPFLGSLAVKRTEVNHVTLQNQGAYGSIVKISEFSMV